MKKWILPLSPQAFELIKNGKKTIEGRSPNPHISAKNYQNMANEDVLVFVKENGPKAIMKYEISYIKHYNTVMDMLKKEGIKKLSPLEDSIENVINKYNSFPGYKERIEKYGIYAIALGEEI